MKVKITSATGSSTVEALIDKDSGVIEFASGEISHVLYEKSYGKKIFVIKEEKKPKEELKKPEPDISTPEQSESRPAKKAKAK